MQQIKEADINFWSKKQDILKLMQKEQLYPPRVKMTVNRRNQSYLKLLIEIRGGYESEEGDLDMKICLDGNNFVVGCLALLTNLQGVLIKTH